MKVIQVFLLEFALFYGIVNGENCPEGHQRHGFDCIPLKNDESGKSWHLLLFCFSFKSQPLCVQNGKHTSQDHLVSEYCLVPVHNMYIFPCHGGWYPCGGYWCDGINNCNETWSRVSELGITSLDERYCDKFEYWSEHYDQIFLNASVENQTCPFGYSGGAGGDCRVNRVRTTGE